MSTIATAERVSLEKSDNYVFQRSVLAYHRAAEIVEGDILEIGTGSGYGVEVIAPKATRYISIDKQLPIDPVQLENAEYYDMEVPPIDFENCSFDAVVSFQVIEHIKHDGVFVGEVRRVLRKGGRFIVSTPNRPMSLTRNPWHVREYDAEELRMLLSSFDDVECLGVGGNERVWSYYEKNRESVRRIMRFDVLRMQWWLPRWLLQLPYDIMNRLNRRRLHKQNRELTEQIGMEDYDLRSVDKGCFDLFYVATK